MAGRDDDGSRDGGQGKGQHRFLGSLKDALKAAGRGDAAPDPAALVAAPEQPRTPSPPSKAELPPMPIVDKASVPDAEMIAVSPAKQPRDDQRSPPAASARGAEVFPEALTRAIRGSDPRKPTAGPARTQLVRGRVEMARGEFHQDPVVGWLIVVGGAGLGAFRPIFEGNNTVGRGRNQRIAIDFGDETISSEEQAYIRYDSADRTFLFVPNLSKTNVVSINNRKPTAAVALQAMDVITMGRTQLAFVPFCGADFDWSELADAKA